MSQFVLSPKEWSDAFTEPCLPIIASALPGTAADGIDDIVFHHRWTSEFAYRGHAPATALPTGTEEWSDEEIEQLNALTEACYWPSLHGGTYGI